MSNPASVAQNLLSSINVLVNALENLRVLNDRLASDATLTAAALAAAAGRSDLVAADFTNTESAITQMLFAFDSGAPTQKSILFKMLP